jgi:hypothetical protein
MCEYLLGKNEDGEQFYECFLFNHARYCEYPYQRCIFKDLIADLCDYEGGEIAD